MAVVPGRYGKARGASRPQRRHLERRGLPAVEGVQHGFIDHAAVADEPAQILGECRCLAEDREHVLDGGFVGTGQASADVACLHCPRPASRRDRHTTFAEVLGQHHDLPVGVGIPSQLVATHDSDDLAAGHEPSDGLGDRVVVDGVDDRVDIRRLGAAAVAHIGVVGLEIDRVAIAGPLGRIEPAEQFVGAVEAGAEGVDRDVAVLQSVEVHHVDITSTS